MEQASDPYLPLRFGDRGYQLAEPLSPDQDEALRLVRQAEDEQVAPLRHGPDRRDLEVHGGESGVPHPFVDALRLETRPFLGQDQRGRGCEIDLGTFDAIQASQGPFGPSRSQRSRQAVDSELRSLDLRHGRHSRHEEQQQYTQ